MAIPVRLSPAQAELLRHIDEAAESWARAGKPARNFLLLHIGGMQSTVVHPGWNETWPTPTEQDIDDLAELGLLRVEPSANKQRAFVLSVNGAQLTSQLHGATSVEAGLQDHGRSPDAPTTAFVSWAHGDANWETTVYGFVQRLYDYGIAAEIDLFHLHDPSVIWADYGPRAIEEADHVLIAVSGAYKRRWEGKEDPTKGAGAALEANALKSIFSDNRETFQRKVKVVVLPGATVDDIPITLKAVVQRFEVDPQSRATFEDLVVHPVS